MAFEGDLKNLPLADVLQTIHQNSLTGTLTVKDDHGERRVAFTQGHIVAFVPAPDDASSVIDALTKRRLVGKADADRARTGFLGKRKNLRSALASRGLVKEEDYKKAVKEELLEGIYDLFLETDRTFKFLDGPPDFSTFDQDQIAAEARIAAPAIVMEGARRVDEWARIRRSIGSFHEVLIKDGGPEEKDDAVTKEILRLADGARPLDVILEELPVARFKGCEAVAALVAARRLRPASSGEYVKLGGQAEERGAFEEAAAFYERGLETERGNLSLRERRAAALERAGRQTEAADERKLLAASLLDQGKRKDAANELARAADLSPRDPSPLERRLQIAQEDRDRDAARLFSARLAALFEDLGLGEKARDVLRAQVARAPDEDDLREKLAELLHRQGDVKSAAREWSELAGRAARKGNFAVAAARYRHAIEVDSTDDRSRVLLRDIESGEITARRTRRKRRIRLAFFVLAVASLAAWLGWEFIALDAYQRAQLEALTIDETQRATPEGIEKALETILAVRDAYPHTLAAAHIDEASAQLVMVYAKSFDQASREPFVPALGPGAIKADSVTKSRLIELADGVKDKGEPPVEQLVRQGDEALERGDRAEAGASFQKALTRIIDARNSLSHASRALREGDDARAMAQRLEPAFRRARAGRLRCLPLSKDARERFEKLVGNALPAVAAPPK